MKYVEFRGFEGLVAAEIISDDNEVEGGYKTGEVFPIAGAGEISKSTETSSEVKPYDNIPAIVIDSEGADTITITCSVPDLATYAKLVGKDIDTETGAMIDGERQVKYFALGYILGRTDGTKRYVWRLKGTFSIPDEGSKTTGGNDTDASNMELTYTGISTSHKFTKNGKPAKAVVVDDTPESKADVSTFFEAVTDPDSLKAKAAAARMKTAKASA